MTSREKDRTRETPKDPKPRTRPSDSYRSPTLPKFSLDIEPHPELDALAKKIAEQQKNKKPLTSEELEAWAHRLAVDEAVLEGYCGDEECQEGGVDDPP